MPIDYRHQKPIDRRSKTEMPEILNFSYVIEELRKHDSLVLKQNNPNKSRTYQIKPSAQTKIIINT
jgi:hypothetical protein